MKREESLYPGKQALQPVLDVLPTILYIYDLASRHTIYGNPAAARSLGYTPEQMRNGGGDFVPQSLHPDDVPCFAGHIQHVAGLPDGAFADCEYRIRHANGGWRWFLGRHAVFARSSDGSASQLIGTATDITERKRAEEALREGEEKFRKMLESTPTVAVRGYAPDGTIKYWNKANEAVYGYTREEAVGKNLIDLIIPPEMREEVRAAIQHGARTGQMPPAAELDLMRKDGSRAPVYSSHAVVFIPGKEPELFCLDVDISRQKQQEERLNRVTAGLLSLGYDFEQNLHILTGLCGDLLHADCALYNRLDGDLLCVRGQWRAPTDLQAEDDPEGHICYDVIRNATDRALVIRNLQETAYAKTDPNVAAYGLRTYVGHPVRFGGTNRGSLCVVYTRDYEASGDDLRVLGILAAAIGQEEERRRMDEELRIRNWAIESSLSAIALSDLEGRLTYVNPSFLRMWGYGAAGEVLGQHASRFWQLESQASQVIVALHEQGNWFGELDARKKDGSAFPAQLSATLVRNREGKPVSMMASFVDLSERRRAEEERKKLQAQLIHSQKMETVGRLAGGVAHDFNNILTAVIGYSNLALLSLAENDPARSSVEQILSAGERAAGLTQSLLAFSRKQIISPKPVSVNAIIERIQKMLLRIIGEDIELRTFLAQGETTVLGDVGQIEQVLINLATNSRDAMPEGGHLVIETGRITIDDAFIHAHGFGAPGEYVRISVSDTGEGMDEKIRQQAFEPFFTTKEVGKGTGLGLAIVYGIVNQHNGHIDVYSEPKRGTTIKVYLPALGAAALSDAAPEPAAPPQGGTETVLLAEDDASVRPLTKVLLETFGYRVIDAVDGQEAVEKLKANLDQIDLLIVDVIMPRKNGKEVYEEARQLKPGIKVLFTSGYPANIIQKKGILEEDLLFLPKPAAPQDLLKKIREVLDR